LFSFTDKVVIRRMRAPQIANDLLMRLLFTLCLLLTHTILSQAQRNAHKPTKRPTGYSLAGRLTNASGQKVYLVEYAFYKAKNRTDSVIAGSNGEFRFTGHLSEATPYLLRTSLNRNELLLYLDNATMLVTGDARQIHLAKVTGSLEETIRQRYDSLWNAPTMWRLITKADTLDKAMEQARTQADSGLTKQLLTQKETIIDQQLALVLGQIKRYPRAAASVNAINSFNGYKRLATADSLLKVYEASGIQQGQVTYFRNELTALRGLSVGKEAPDFVEADTAGHPIRLSSFRGQYVLVDFWASWCGPCRKEHPTLIKEFNAYKASRFTVLSVSIDDDRKNWLTAIQSDKLPWPQISSLRGSMGEAPISYGINSVPTNYLLDPMGRIVAINLHGAALSQKLKELLR
jgi:peroxiredoxin